MNKLTKHPGGRPSKYDMKVIFPKIGDYLEQCSREQTKLPSVEGLALFIGINPDTIYEWSKKYPEFSEYIKRLAAKQKDQLINDGMYGGKEVNASMAIFLLKAIHGLRDGAGTTAVQVNFNKVLQDERKEFGI